MTAVIYPFQKTAVKSNRLIRKKDKNIDPIKRTEKISEKLIQVDNIPGNGNQQFLFFQIRLQDINFGKRKQYFFAEDFYGKNDIAGIVCNIRHFTALASRLFLDLKAGQQKNVIILRFLSLKEPPFDHHVISHKPIRLLLRVHIIEFHDIGLVIPDGQTVFRYKKRNRCSIQQDKDRFVSISFQEIRIGGDDDIALQAVCLGYRADDTAIFPGDHR